MEVAIDKEISLVIIGKSHFKWWSFIYKSALLRNMLLKTESTDIDIIIIS